MSMTEVAKQDLYEQMSSELTRKQRRNLGLLPRQVLRGIRKMKKDGLIDEDMTVEEMSAIYVMEISAGKKYGDAWEGVQDGTYGFDWEQFRIFVEMILEWLMVFLPLFI